MKNTGTFVLGCLAAATVGIGVGILLAPDTGDNLRKKLRDAGADWLDKIVSMTQPKPQDSMNDRG